MKNNYEVKIQKQFVEFLENSFHIWNYLEQGSPLYQLKNTKIDPGKSLCISDISNNKVPGDTLSCSH